jgi:predicted  nucleic acid-binding Zn-ribbon protein
MLDTIEKLLVLQDRDRNIGRVKGELAHIDPERQDYMSRASGAQAALDKAKLRVKEIESKRKDLELEVEAKNQLITKYANQQLQTRKNEEYRALTHEIEMAKEAIFKIEDQELALMEQAETAQKEVAACNATLAQARKMADEQIAQLGAREQNLKKELAELEVNRGELASAVDDTARGRYERLVRNKGENVIVGIQHGVCGGCHMKLPTQILVSARAQQDLITCINCGRILYYTHDMDLAVAE